MGAVILFIVFLAIIGSAVKSGKAQSQRQEAQRRQQAETMQRQSSARPNTAQSSARPNTARSNTARPNTPRSNTTYTAARSNERRTHTAQSDSGHSRTAQAGAAQPYQTRTAQSAVGSSKQSWPAWEAGRKPEEQELTKKKQVTADKNYDKTSIIEAAKANILEVEMENDKDAREDLMAGVYDAMLTGPKNSMTFQRDFLAEGLDMLNAFQVGDK